MEKVNQTSSVSEFILLGLSSRPEDQKPLFVLFLIIYLVTIAGNLLIILVIQSDPHLQTPMYFLLSSLSFTDVCFATTIVPKMLVNFLSESKTISYAGCLTQMYFLYALGNSDSCLLAVMALPLCYHYEPQPLCPAGGLLLLISSPSLSPAHTFAESSHLL
jgi:olfactory receptor